MDEGDLLLVLGALSFLPPLALLVMVRNDEKHQREPMRALLALFLYAGTLGVALALFLHSLTGGRTLLWTAVFVAPFTEELSKGLGLGFARRRILEPEDGLVYGAALGLGFAATENLVYALTAYGEDGADTALTVAIARIFSSMLLHAASSALLGFGYSLAVLRGGVAWQLLPFYLVAVGLHSLYNFLVIGQTWLGFGVAVALVFVVMGLLRRRIRQLDARIHINVP